MTPFEFKAGRAADAYYRHTQRLNIRLESAYRLMGLNIFILLADGYTD